SDDALTLTLDGVSFPLEFVGAVGMDPGGKHFQFSGLTNVTGGTTFSELLITLDYALDSGDQPLIITPGTQELFATADSFILFERFEDTMSLETDIGPLLVVVPEPATMGLGGAMLFLALRRRPRRPGV